MVFYLIDPTDFQNAVWQLCLNGWLIFRKLPGQNWKRKIFVQKFFQNVDLDTRNAALSILLNSSHSKSKFCPLNSERSSYKFMFLLNSENNYELMRFGQSFFQKNVPLDSDNEKKYIFLPEKTQNLKFLRNLNISVAFYRKLGSVWGKKFTVRKCTVGHLTSDTIKWQTSVRKTFALKR